MHQAYNVKIRYIAEKYDEMDRLTRTEEELMQMIWDQGSCTVRDLLQLMPEPRPPHSTVSSVVRILEQKGFVSHKAYGRTYLYFPVISKEDYSRQALGLIIDRYFDQSAEQMLSFLVEEEQIDYEALSDILNKIKEKNRS